MAALAPTALGELYRRHAPALRLYARQWPGVGDEDLVHDAFVLLARQDPPPDRVLPWLYGVVRNNAATGRRADARRKRREGVACAPEALFAAADDRVEAEEAARMLGELAVEVREAIVAKLWGGLTFEDIARLAHCSVPTAHRRYHAGLAELRARLEGRWTKPNTVPTT